MSRPARSLGARLLDAVAGLVAAWRAERSFRIEVSLAGGWLLVLAVLQPIRLWWLLSLLISALVLSAELMNTALEHLADHLAPEQHPKVRVAKDCAAGAVLLLAAAALVVVAFTLWSTLGSP